MTIDKKLDYVNQDGFKNYIKNSKSVTVPREFKSRKDATPTKLAYITKDEAKMLKKMKKGTPHKGPKGIPSYDDFDAATGSFRSGAAMSAAETGGKTERDRADLRAAGIGPQEAQDIRSSVIAAGAGQRVNPGFFDSKNIISPTELRLAREYAKTSPFAKKAFARTRGGGLLGFIKSGGILGNLIRKIGQGLGFGKKFNEPTYDMRKFSDLGLLTDRVNPDYYLDQDNDDLLSITSTPKIVTSVNNQVTPLSIFDDQVAPMGAKVDKGIIQALASSTVPEIATDYVNQLEKGEPITDDEQMFIDNEIANLRFP